MNFLFLFILYNVTVGHAKLSVVCCGLDQTGVENVSRCIREESVAKKNESRDVYEMQKQVASLRAGYFQLDDGWIGLYNGFQFKPTSTKQSYENSLAECEGMGASLAVYGVQDVRSRRILRNVIGANDHIWIGLKDKDSEGFWKWENGGGFAFDYAALWGRDQPDGGSGENCGIIYLEFNGLSSSDVPCANHHYGLCEKAWEI